MSVIANAAVSIDGFVADEDDQVGPLFDWYDNGDVEMYGTDRSRPCRVSAASAAYVQPIWDRVAAVVIGRHLFDLTDGWGGVPAVGEHDVSLTAGNLTGQALAEGLVDELCVDIVPVVFGSGVRFFGDYAGPQVRFEDPEVVQGDRVTHLRFRTARSAAT